jgi:sulfatase modifying factor 1
MLFAGRYERTTKQLRPTPVRPPASAVVGAAVAAVVCLCAVGSARAADVVAPAWIEHPAKPFAIFATEVTVAQYHACVAAGACEESTVDPACNYGRSGADKQPVNCVNYHGAEQFCAWAGGHVCIEEQWLDACKGTELRSFPYGTTFDLEACNSQSQTTTVAGRERATWQVASHPSCEGGLPGLFDMAGNVAEWVDACKGDYCKFRGAGYYSNDPVERFAACRGVCSGNDKSLQSGVVGIRCCRDRSQ